MLRLWAYFFIPILRQGKNVMFAVIKTGGRQYLVREGDVLQVEKLGAEAGQKILFDQVLLIEAGGETFLGTPLLGNAGVRAEVVRTLKGEKILVFKKKRRKQYRRLRGHRQLLTEVRIEKILADKTAVPAEEVQPPAVAAAPVPAPAETKPAKAEEAPKPALKVKAPRRAGKKAAAPEQKKKKEAPKAKAAAPKKHAEKPKAKARTSSKK
jgi:large subunit ribosomal protein L21